MADHLGRHQDRGSVVTAQDSFHDAQHAYEPGSPHLRHPQIRNAVTRDLQGLVGRARDRHGRCRVIEIGAGHGTFTETLLAGGAQVTVTEASQASAALLQERYAHDSRVQVFYDSTGEETLDLVGPFDLVVCVSVLHHIPDYLRFIDALTDRVEEGGAFYSVQDPLWYPRIGAAVHAAHMAAYFAWRVPQGDLWRGIGTRIRRLRRVYDDSPSDLVEYHVVRQGVDEEAIAEHLRAKFSDVDVFRYWSTQSPALQTLGQLTRMRSNFGVVASGRLIDLSAASKGRAE
jgi:2-polyprenyl-6-hydroxyphenyl methylase / 3-demethylubiquinone-9 3-methyltransferase